MEAELAARRMLNSGQRSYQEGRIRDEFGRRWRDRKRQADRISGLVPDLRGDILMPVELLRTERWAGGGVDL